MSRPSDWTPLDTTDPVPGEPDRIVEEARRLRDTAAEMRDQIARLRTIGQDGTQVSRSADALRAAATELGGRLERTVGRYEQVAGVLGEWEPVLRQAQDDSARILERAKAADQTRLQNAAPPAPGRALTPEEAQQERGREMARDGALADLAGERSNLDNLVDSLDDAAGTYADRISAAIDDSVADSGWDDVEDFYDRNAEDIKWWTDFASLVGTGLAIGAMFFTGPIGWAILAVGVGVVASEAMLYATGNGSGTDIATAAFGLVTFGAGSIATSGLKASRIATRAAGARSAGRAAERASLEDSFPLRSAAERVLAKPDLTPNIRELARRRVSTSLAQAQARKDAASLAEQQRLPSGPRVQDKILTGDRAAAGDLADARETLGRFSSDPQVAAAGNALGSRQRAAAVATIGGLGVDVGDKIAAPPFGLPPPVPAYAEWKDQFKRVQGSAW